MNMNVSWTFNLGSVSNDNWLLLFEIYYRVFPHQETGKNQLIIHAILKKL